MIQTIIICKDLLVCMEDTNHKIDDVKRYQFSWSWKFRNFQVKSEYFCHSKH